MSDDHAKSVSSFADAKGYIKWPSVVSTYASRLFGTLISASSEVLQYWSTRKRDWLAWKSKTKRHKAYAIVDP